MDEERKSLPSDLNTYEIRKNDKAVPNLPPQSSYTTNDPMRDIQESYELPGDSYVGDVFTAAWRGISTMVYNASGWAYNVGMRTAILGHTWNNFEGWLEPNEIAELYPGLEVEHGMHPMLAEYLNQRLHFTNKISERFKGSAFQLDNKVAMAASWAGALGAMFLDRPERAIDNMLVAAFGKGAGLVAKTGSLALRPAAAILAGSKMAKYYKAITPAIDISKYGAVGAHLARTGKALRYSAKARMLAKHGVANALIEVGIAHEANSAGQNYDMVLAATMGMLGPVVLSGLGMVLKGSALTSVRGIDGLLNLHRARKQAKLDKLLDESPPPELKKNIFKKGTKKGKRTADNMNFDKQAKEGGGVHGARGRVAEANGDPVVNKGIKEGLDGTALLQNKHINKIKKLFGVRGVKAAQDWANAVRATGYRVVMEDAFPWLKKSVRELKEAMARGDKDVPSKDPNRAFDMPAERLYEYTNTHKLKEQNPPTKPIRDETPTDILKDLEAKIEHFSTQGGDLGKIGKSIKQVKDLTDKLQTCIVKGGSDTEGAA